MRTDDLGLVSAAERAQHTIRDYTPLAADCAAGLSICPGQREAALIQVRIAAELLKSRADEANTVASRWAASALPRDRVLHEGSAEWRQRAMDASARAQWVLSQLQSTDAL